MPGRCITPLGTAPPRLCLALQPQRVIAQTQTTPCIYARSRHSAVVLPQRNAVGAPIILPPLVTNKDINAKYTHTAPSSSISPLTLFARLRIICGRFPLLLCLVPCALVVALFAVPAATQGFTAGDIYSCSLSSSRTLSTARKVYRNTQALSTLNF